jgi:hypothetical protein
MCVPFGKVKAQDEGWTPTEKRVRDERLRAFMKNPKGGGGGNSAAYQEGWLRIFGKRDKDYIQFVWSIADVNICHSCGKEFAKEQIQRHLDEEHWKND